MTRAWSCCCVAVVAMLPRVAAAQGVRYEVSVASAPSHLFHVRAEFPTAGEDTLLVSLPAWSPGSYEIQNYARYVRHFGATAAGRALFWDRADKDTWRVPTGGAPRVVVEFDFLGDAIDLSSARLTPDFGQFLGTNLFLFEEGKLDRSAEVRFSLPAGWQVATALRPGAGGAYTAADYHELADAMSFVGRFSLDSLQVDAKWIRIAVWPADAYNLVAARSLRSSVERIARVQNRLMGGPPYDTYTVFFNVYREAIPFAGGLEHSASQFDIMPADGFVSLSGELGSFMNPLMAHEFFHLWNVKRIRPAEMWPYDYHAEQYTPLLWWSEGVTDYYGDLTNLRAGLWTEGEFVGSVDGNVQQVESAPEPWSAEDGSEATWINEVFVNSSQLYYPKGSVLGLLLDISIRDATNNAKSLDDVMRGLYTRYSRQGKGFRTGDLLALLKEVGLPDPDGFYQRYVNGREPLPYDSILPKAGLEVERRQVTSVLLGVSTGVDSTERVVVGEVVPGSAAEAAGVQSGDVLLKVGDIDVSGNDAWASQLRTRYRGRAGAPLAVVVERGGRSLALAGTVRERTLTQVTVGRAASATPKAARIWRGIASGTTGN